MRLLVTNSAMRGELMRVIPGAIEVCNSGDCDGVLSDSLELSLGSFRYQYERMDEDAARSIVSVCCLSEKLGRYGLLPSSPSMQCKGLLMRVFRSMDYDFDGKVLISDLSDYHRRVFGCELCSRDIEDIHAIVSENIDFRIHSINRFVMLSYSDFLFLMERMRVRGYGIVVERMIEDYYRNCETVLKINGTVKGLTKSADDFLAWIFKGFGYRPTQKQLEELFGTVPHRFSVKTLTRDIWLMIWHEWVLVSPTDVLHELLELGFPPNMIYDAISIEQQSNYVPAAIAAGTLIASAAGFFMSRRFR